MEARQSCHCGLPGQHNHLDKGPAGQNVRIRSNSIGRTSRGDARVDACKAYPPIPFQYYRGEYGNDCLLLRPKHVPISVLRGRSFSDPIISHHLIGLLLMGKPSWQTSLQ